MLMVVFAALGIIDGERADARRDMDSLKPPRPATAARALLSGMPSPTTSAPPPPPPPPADPLGFAP